MTDLTTNKGKVAESNINWKLLNTDRSALFTSVVSASKRHAHYNGRGSIPNMSCYYVIMHFRARYVNVFTFLADKSHIGYNSVSLQFSYVP